MIVDVMAQLVSDEWGKRVQQNCIPCLVQMNMVTKIVSVPGTIRVEDGSRRGDKFNTDRKGEAENGVDIFCSLTVFGPLLWVNAHHGHFCFWIVTE